VEHIIPNWSCRAIGRGVLSKVDKFLINSFERHVRYKMIIGVSNREDYGEKVIWAGKVVRYVVGGDMQSKGVISQFDASEK